MVSLLLVLLAELLLAPVAPSLLVLLLQVSHAEGTAAEAAGDAPGRGAEGGDQGAEQAIHLARLRHFKRTEKSPRQPGL